MDLGAPIREVGEHNSTGFNVIIFSSSTEKMEKGENLQVNGAGKHAGTETTNRGGRYLGKVYRTNNACLSNTDTSNEAACIYCSHATIVANEDSDSENPEAAELSGSPNTSNAIANDEGTIVRKVLERMNNITA